MLCLATRLLTLSHEDSVHFPQGHTNEPFPLSILRLLVRNHCLNCMPLVSLQLSPCFQRRNFASLLLNTFPTNMWAKQYHMRLVCVFLYMNSISYLFDFGRHNCFAGLQFTLVINTFLFPLTATFVAKIWLATAVPFWSAIPAFLWHWSGTYAIVCNILMYIFIADGGVRKDLPRDRRSSQVGGNFARFVCVILRFAFWLLLHIASFMKFVGCQQHRHL